MARTATERSAPDRRIDLVLWLVSFASAAATLVFSFGPAPPGTHAFPGADKFWHAVSYFITLLSFMLAGVWRPGRGDGVAPRAAGAIVVAAVVSGVVIEILQGTLGNRTAEALDVAAEGAGSLAALLVLVALRRRAGRSVGSRA